MKIRDSHAKLNGDPTVFEAPSGGIDIIAENGRTLFAIHQTDDGFIEVRSWDTCKVNGVVMDTSPLVIEPVAGNVVKVSLRPWVEVRRG